MPNALDYVLMLLVANYDAYGEPNLPTYLKSFHHSYVTNDNESEKLFKLHYEISCEEMQNFFEVWVKLKPGEKFDDLAYTTGVVTIPIGNYNSYSFTKAEGDYNQESEHIKGYIYIRNKKIRN